MKNTDKNSPQNKKDNQDNNDTLLYILLFLLFAVLVGSLIYYFNLPKDTWNHDYSELGKKVETPTAKDITQLISGNRSRLKSARRVLKGRMIGRNMTEEEKAKIREELKGVDKSIDRLLQEKEVSEIEKENPDFLKMLYDKLYEQGEITVRLRDKTAVQRTHEELVRQKEFQDQWDISAEEKQDIDLEMGKWIKKWFDRAKEKIIDSGQEKQLTHWYMPLWIEGKEVENRGKFDPDSNLIEKLKQQYLAHPSHGLEVSQPTKIKFEGYYGFLTEEDKKDSGEGTETFGLTKHGPHHDRRWNLWGWGKRNGHAMLDDGNGSPIKPDPTFNSFYYYPDNTIPIRVGFEKKLFFNRLGYEEWISEVKEGNARRWFDICFESVVETIAHELAHVIVNHIKVNYQGAEGGGHGKFFYEKLKEIKKMMRAAPDFDEFKEWWNAPKKNA